MAKEESQYTNNLVHIIYLWLTGGCAITRSIIKYSPHQKKKINPKGKLRLILLVLHNINIFQEYTYLNCA